MWRGYHRALERAYQFYATDTLGWGAVADQLNEEGYPYATRTGDPRLWDKDDVRRVLDLNLIYRGHLTAGRSKSTTDPEIVYRNAWSPILPLDLIHRATRVLEGRHGDTARHTHKRVYPLTPLVHCAHCGKQLSGQTYYGHRFYRHYRKGTCPGSVGQIKARAAEEEAARILSGLAIPPAEWPGMPAMFRSVLAESKLEKTAAELALLRDERERLKSLFKEQQVRGVEVMTWQEYARDLHDYDQKIATLEARRTQHFDPAGAQAAMEALSDLGTLIQNAGEKSQKRLFASVFDSLLLDCTTAGVRYRLRPWAQPFLDTVIQCARRDSNPHDLAITSPSS